MRTFEEDAFGIIVLLVIFLCVSQCGPTTLVERTVAYRRGQVDCMNGLSKYHIVTNKTTETKWEFKK